MFSKFLVFFCAFTVGLSTPAPLLSDTITKRGEEIVPFTPVGNVAAIQVTSGDSRLYHQKSDGSIWQEVAVGSFDTGTNGGDNQIVPVGNALLGTPLVAVLLGEDAYEEVHVIFFSPDYVLSEAIWSPTLGSFKSGAACPQCITNLNIVAKEGSNVLYAMQNEATGTLRIGFVSAGAPGTISELDNDTGTWNVAALPN